MFVSLSQIPNIDFEGLFGNMQMVIKVSKQLLADLEISDAVGMSSRSNLFFFFNFMGRRQEEKGLAKKRSFSYLVQRLFGPQLLLLSAAYFEVI